MPRIADCFADCSIYFYESEDDARQGSKFGGSGFLAHVPSSTRPNTGHLYAITNKHVIDAGCGVIRFTRKTGGIDAISTQWTDWFPDPNGNDVVVLPLDIKDFFRWWSVSTDKFINQEVIDSYRIGYGDEAFLVGRLVNQAGRQKNTPVIRFGNISLMADPSEKISVEDREQEGFLVECRSLSGFSGSPVFVSTTQCYGGDGAKEIVRMLQKEAALEASRAFQPFPANNAPGISIDMQIFEGTFGPWLLGIDWGHVPLWNAVYLGQQRTEMRVEANTGIACVLPAWHILNTLNLDELMEQRKQEDERISTNADDAPINDVPERDVSFTEADLKDSPKKG